MADPLRGVTRRELLKLSPLIGLGAFAVPTWRERLLEAGVAWSDGASGCCFAGNMWRARAPTLRSCPLIDFRTTATTFSSRRLTSKTGR